MTTTIALTAESLLAMSPAERAALPRVVLARDDGCSYCSHCEDCSDCSDCSYCSGITGGRGLRYVAWGVQLTAAQWDLLLTARPR